MFIIFSYCNNDYLAKPKLYSYFCGMQQQLQYKVIFAGITKECLWSHHAIQENIKIVLLFALLLSFLRYAWKLPAISISLHSCYILKYKYKVNFDNYINSTSENAVATLVVSVYNVYKTQ